MAGFQCPYCNQFMTIDDITVSHRYPSFSSSTGYDPMNEVGHQYNSSCLGITFYRCPNCNKITVEAKGYGKDVNDINMQIKPLSKAKQYPDYIPKSIRQDYEEACSIVSLSPKASATLSRRCLQGMIRDFWKISKSNLYLEIDALKDKIPSDLWSSLDALRQLGNIGAHMEKDTNVIIDIDTNEASILISLIELLMKEWYINREERTRLFSTIKDTNNAKQSNRKKTE